MDLYRRSREFILSYFEQEVPVVVPLSKETAGHNHLIVRKIAEYFPLGDLKILRFVSRHWNYSVSDAYLRRSFVNLSSLDKLRKYTEEVEPFAHSKFYFQGLYYPTTMTSMDQVIALQPFFEKYGNQILKLYITFDLRTIHGIENLQGWLGLLRTLKNIQELDIYWNFYGPLPTAPFVIPVLPTLRRIIIDIMAYEEDYGELQSQIEVDHIATSLSNVVLTMAPNLQHLLIGHLHVASEQYMKDAFWRNFVPIVSRSPPLHLNKLSFRGTDRTLTTLLEMPIRLTHLRIDMNPGVREDWQEHEVGINAYNILYDFLEIHATTLEFIFIDVYPLMGTLGKWTIPLELPNSFPKLTHLQLRFNSYYYTREAEFPMTPIINYPERFPKLKTICVLTGSYSYCYQDQKLVHDVMFPKGGRVCNSVRTIRLRLPESHYLRSLFLFWFRLTVGRTFPNAEMINTKFYGIPRTEFHFD